MSRVVSSIRITIPPHLRTLARVEGEIVLEVASEATLVAVLDALEARYPVLRGTIRDHTSKRRRPFVRFFVCNEDWSHCDPDTVLPKEVSAGKQPLIVIGAMAGG